MKTPTQKAAEVTAELNAIFGGLMAPPAPDPDIFGIGAAYEHDQQLRDAAAEQRRRADLYEPLRDALKRVTAELEQVARNRGWNSTALNEANEILARCAEKEG